MLRPPLHLSLLLLAGILLEDVHALSEHNQGLSAQPMNIIVIGRSSGMGNTAAITCVKRGRKALIVSRSKDKLAKAAEEVRSYAPSETSSVKDLLVETAILDATDEDAVKKFVAETLTRSEENASDLDTSSD
jgi:NAD(P)-dependent dehydrogenase (short-subunit alcohol dehydrogenase family)